MNIIRRSRFALKLNRENTNPSIDETNSVKVTPGIATIIVFRKYLGISASVHALKKLSRVRVRGNET